MPKVLVIDDEKPTLSMFKLVLEELGHETLTAESGEEGLDIFDRESPQIVLTDIKMPGMDGLEVLRRIKEKNPTTEVVVITGHGDIELALTALNLNATDFIDKPVRHEALVLALQRAKDRLAMVRECGVLVRLERLEAANVIFLKGNIGMRCETPLAAAGRKAMDDGSKPLVVSFDKSASINGAGIAVLTQLLLDAGKNGRAVAIAGLSDNFRKVFEIVGLTKIAVTHDTLEQALASLPGKAG